MSSENPSGADNQQERLCSSDWLNGIPDDLGHYIAGFVEGEGSFNVPFIRKHYGSLPWRVTLSFNVSQVGPQMPLLLRETLGTGRVRGRSDGVFYFEVTSRSIYKRGSFLSSIDSASEAPRRKTSRSSRRSRSSFDQDVI